MGACIARIISEFKSEILLEISVIINRTILWQVKLVITMFFAVPFKK
jgi:hypothetical protein